jgi:Leucine-rich repeat (LRR) protein
MLAAQILPRPDLTALARMPRKLSLAAALKDPAGATHVSDRGLLLRTLPPEIGALRDLQHLTLNECGIEELPDALWRLSGLRSLNLFDNAIREVSPEIGRLARLEKLVLGTNDLRTLPAELAALPALTELNLANNPRLDWAQAMAIISRIERLERLSIYQNPIRELPEIGRLTWLRVLHAFGCELRAVPAALEGLAELRELDLRANEIEAFDVDPSRLPHLERLDLSYNRLPADAVVRLRGLERAGMRIILEPQSA